MLIGPFNVRAVKNQATKLLRQDCPIDRIPARLAEQFKSLDYPLSEWDFYFKSFYEDVKNEFESNFKFDEKGYSISEVEALEKLVKNGCNLLITGKAGTGKTTLLKKIVEEYFRPGTVAIIAPTGIAAKNAGGVTIHSFLKLKIGPWVPTNFDADLCRLTYADKQLLQSISAIVIDEVSMVRCDLMDQIDYVLRYARDTDKPFGGVQLILFGDLFQLMPVVTEEDMDVLKHAYKNPFFFSSKAFGKVKKHVINLKKVFRQDEPEFVDILNSIRIGKISPYQLATINSRFSASYENMPTNGSIRLTTHNRQADAHNRAKLADIRGEEYTFRASVKSPYEDGTAFIDKSEWPTDFFLNLKVGARVMFLTNDKDGNRYVNGTLGYIVDLWEDGVIVKTDEGVSVNLNKYSWWFSRYRYNKLTKKVEKEDYAIFKQYPLRLAWAVTVHKSQGLTFDRIFLDLSKSFTAGQVYVALSRCRTLAGIHLIKRLAPKNIMCDDTVLQFYKEIGIDIK